MNDRSKSEPGAKARERSEFRRVRGRYAGYSRARLAHFARRLKRAIYPERESLTRIELAGPTERMPFKDVQALRFRDVQVGEPLGPLWSTYWVRLTARSEERRVGKEGRSGGWRD